MVFVQAVEQWTSSTLCRILGGTWEFAQLVHMCFVDLEKAFDRLPRGVLWGVLREYGVSDPLIRGVHSLYDRCQSLVRIASNKSDLFPVSVGPILFIIFMDRISRCSQGVEGVQFGDLRIGSLLFADQQADRCAVCSNADSAQIRRGEEGAEPKGEALDLPVDLRFYPHLWS